MDFCLLLLCWQMTWMTLPSAGKSSRRACAHQFLTESSSTAGIWSEAQKQVHLKAVQTESEGGCNDSVKVLIWAVYALVPCGAAWLKLFLKKKKKIPSPPQCVTDLLPVFSLNSRHSSFSSEEIATYLEWNISLSFNRNVDQTGFFKSTWSQWEIAVETSTEDWLDSISPSQTTVQGKPK